VGGLDLGFERAGIETVSVSEIDPYACAVLAERFPDAPNLGSITEVDANDIPEADIWSGGFPCQDLSVAGKRAGFAGKRSSLAFTFLDLVEQRRPRWLVLENVPGLFSSNKGADFGRLLYEMEQLGYGVSWRTLDARYFGVAQRRRRVFIVASLESDRAGEVLLECEGCERHPSPRWTQGQGAASGVRDGSGVVGALPAGVHGFPDGVQEFLQGHFRVVGEDGRTIGATADANGVRAVDGLARRLDNQQEVDTQRVGTFEMYDFPADAVAPSMNALRARDLMAYQTRADEKNGNFTIAEAEVANSLSALWPGDTSHRSMTLVQAVIQDSREMANKTQNGAGFSTEDISYTLTGVDRQAVATESILSFPSRFGSNANVTEGQAQSMAHSAGAPAVFRKSARAQTNEDSETWVEGDVANTLNSFDVGDVRTTHAILSPSLHGKAMGGGGDIGQDEAVAQVFAALGGSNEVADDALLPIGLDSHRYRCCGNGVVAPVAEWIGRRIVEVDRRWREEEAK
jgi:DNA-cytosine methyltransferase